MKDPLLLQATASEPLTYDEECVMQHSWQNDPNKCTFIVLARDLLCCNDDFDDNNHLVSSVRVKSGENDEEEERPGVAFENASPIELDADFLNRNVPAMVGDVNLFLSPLNDDDDENDNENDNESNDASDNDRPPNHSNGNDGAVPTPTALQAEIDIMIAETAYRNKGLGREATCCMLWYGAQHLDIMKYVCKIHESNGASLSLFEHSLGFERRHFAQCFGEWELVLDLRHHHHRRAAADDDAMGPEQSRANIVAALWTRTQRRGGVDGAVNSSTPAITVCHIASHKARESTNEASDDNDQR